VTSRGLFTSFAAAAALCAGLVQFDGQVAALANPTGAQTSHGRETKAQPAPAQGRPQGGGQRGGGPSSPTPSLLSFPWWKDETVKKEIGLTDALAARIERNYQDQQGELAEMAVHLRKERDEMEALIAERTVSPDTLALKVVQVEALRGKWSATRLITYYRSARSLAPEQYQKLRAWWQGRNRNATARTTDVSVGFTWWKDEAIKKAIGLDEETSKRIEEHYQRRQVVAASMITELQKQQSELDALIAERKVQPQALEVKVVQVEALRSRINETRTVMLYRFYTMMSLEQNQKFRALLAQQRGRGRGGAGS
jgi:Spy/CpxP family protein refolding chaperone